LQLPEEVVEPQVGQQRAGVLALHRLPLHIAACHAMIVRDRTARRNLRRAVYLPFLG